MPVKGSFDPRPEGRPYTAGACFNVHALRPPSTIEPGKPLSFIYWPIVTCFFPAGFLLPAPTAASV